MIVISSVGYRERADSFASFAQRFVDAGFCDFEATWSLLPGRPLQPPVRVVAIAMEISSDKSLPSFADENDEERKNAFVVAEKAVAKAAALNCRRIILPPARSDSRLSIEREASLQRCFENTPGEYPQHLDKLLRERDDTWTNKRVEQLCRSLFTLCKRFPDIIWCIPPARGLYGVPLTPTELGWIFDDLSHPHLQYWHNTGICHIQEQRMIAKSVDWLDRHGHRTAGIHLEDVISGESLYPPGIGEVEFRELAPYISRNMLQVLRTSHQFASEHLHTAIDYLKGCKIL